MRADMYKVLIERPRSGWRVKTRRGNKPRVDDWDGEDGFEDRVAPRLVRTKYFDDHLQPLRRWLRAQLNRPWSKVYSEICATIDRRSTTGQHLLDHLAMEVCVHCEIDERGIVTARATGFGADTGSRVSGFYVHPRTGMLRWSDWRRARERRCECAMPRDAPTQVQATANGGFRLRLEGIWYACEAVPMTVDQAGQPDFVHGCRRWTISNKRQLARAELRAAGLVNSPRK